LKKEKILDISKINWNLNIFAVNLENIKEKLLEIKEVKSVKIKRTISGGIEIYIVEKVPFMYWEMNGLKKIISDNGEVLNFPNFKEDLLLVKGENANSKIKILMDKIKKHSFLANQFLSAEYIDNYRWDIYLKKNVQVKLPFEELTDSIKLLNKIIKNNNFKESDYRIIDMRVIGKVYFK
ncbi:cell division protein FtsQ/DivIB, partial [Rickettsiales bacterium]|nr:cell division protein FtsQ/DivIB [Rickettsiales bacterium]